ncbi:MAG TPA: amidohydrolase family protein [Vicinamibacterales bacterium]|nr:amidohydrolase family protein [Vicinamibacterales bacterium]
MKKHSRTDQGPSRRAFIGTAAGAGLALAAGAPDVLLSAQATPGAPAPGAAAQDLTLVNGRIHTLDARNTVVSAVSIRNGRVALVSNTAPPRTPNTRVIDLRGRTVVPGLIEAHVHIVSLANRPGYHTILENTASVREIQQALAARRKNVPEGQWITSMGGWHPNQWAEHRHPTLKELDEAVPDRPVLLYERFTGPCVTNSLGKKFFDAVDAAAPVHPEIKKVAVADNGVIAAAGFAGGGPSASALFHLRRLQTFDDKKRSTLDAMAYSASVGLTAHLDQVLFPTPGPLHPNQILSNLDQYRMYDAWLALHREGRSSVRLQMNFLQNQNDPALPELKERLRNQFQFFGDDMMMTGSIGEWAAPLASGAVWREAQRLVAQAGWRNENSVQNLAGLTQVVEAYEAVNKEFDITRLRWMVHHVPEVNADLLNRLRALGCGVQMAAFRWVTSTDPNVVVGPPFRTIADHGIQAGIHGDGVHIAPLNPWLHIYFATTGVNSFGAKVNGNQQLTREEALRLFTRGNSWFLRMEERIGSIEPGRLADLVVLDRDYFSVPDVQIKQIRSVLTVVDGKIVHDAGIGLS